MGESAAVRSVGEQVEQVAASRLSVLIQGETGTGKELVARAIHERANGHAAPFVDVDCGAIPESLVHAEFFGHERGAFTGAEDRREGVFQLADGGTLFVDEVGNLSLATQASLLRVLQERQFRPIGSSKTRSIDVWVITATNLDLRAAVAQRQFREDLYYRLGEFTIALPALRDRVSDIPHLVQRCLVEIAMELGRPVQTVADQAMEALLRHRWPGNVRELRNVVRQAAVRSAGIIQPEHLQLGDTTPIDTRAAVPQGEPRSLRELAADAVARAEQHAIREALRACGGNKTRAARMLRIDFKTLHIKMRDYRITGGEAVQHREWGGVAS